MQVSAKPPYVHSIVHVNAGEVIPDTFLRKLCSEHGSCVGLVVRESTKLEVEKFLDLGTAEERFDLLNKVNLNTKKYPRQFVFGAFPDEFDEDECQPWIVLKDSKGNPLLTVSCEGDFPVATSKEGESEAFVIMHTDLGPKIESMYQLCGNNPQKLFDYIRSAQFSNDVNRMYSFRGAFAFMPTIGDPVILGNFREEGKGGSDYSWGAASFNHGYTEEVVAAATAETATAPAKKPRSKYAEEPVEEPKPSVPAVPLKTDPPKPEEKVADDINALVDWAPPKALHGKALKKSYRDMLGHLPTNWQNRPSFRIKSAGMPAPKKETVTAKDMRQDAPKAVLPVIDGAQQQKAVDFIKKYLGDGSADIGDHPLEAQKQEATLSVFSELCLRSGDLDEIIRWPVSGIFSFTKLNPEAAALLIIELRRDRINRKSMVKDGDKTLGELTGTSGTTENGNDTKTPPPSDKPEAPPAMPEVRRSKYA